MAKHEVIYHGKVISRLDIKKSDFDMQEAAIKRALPEAKLVAVKKEEPKKVATAEEAE